MAAKPPKPEQPIMAFESATAFEQWLEEAHQEHQGIWLRIYKKGSKTPTITYAEAVEVGLCFGWIDGQKNKHDDESWVQKFTKRGQKSVWSKVNVGHIERLTKEGRMRPAGHKTVEEAKTDGRWDKAYSSSSTAEMPEDFLKALAKNKKAKAFYDTLNKTNTYAMYYRITSVKKAETRERKIREFVEMLEKEQKIH
jgi:uncharacterized protein YdeI (YjbR/CyaY-like superfamily)